MTRKDYIKFAEMFRELDKYMAGEQAKAFLEVVVEKACKVFVEDNPRFNKDRFFQAVYNKEEV